MTKLDSLAFNSKDDNCLLLLLLIIVAVALELEVLEVSGTKQSPQML
jgi:hypothetical protein